MRTKKLKQVFLILTQKKIIVIVLIVFLSPIFIHNLYFKNEIILFLFTINAWFSTILSFLFYLVMLSIKNKYKTIFISSLFFTAYNWTQIILKSTLLPEFFSNNYMISINLILLYIYVFCLFYAANIFLMEYLNVDKSQKDMEKRNLEIIEISEKKKEITRLKGEFLANMSHELRTPLNGILGSSNLLIQTNLTAEQRNYIDMLKISGNNLLIVITEILEFSKIEANKLELEQEPFEINSCIENVLELLAPAAAEQKTELIYNIDSNIPTHIIGDMARVQQILTHLIDNAVKFTENGYAYINLTMLPMDKNYFYLKFSVRDTGTGIAEENLVKIFQTFSQIDGSSTRKYGGTGLGLSIAKKLVEMMGGKIEVTSKINEGSEFSFTIKTSYVKNNEYQIQIKDYDKIGIDKFKKRTIILYEKNILLAESIKNRFIRWGLNVILNSDINVSGLPTKDDTVVLMKIESKYFNAEKPIRYSQLFESLVAALSVHSHTESDEKFNTSKLSELYPLCILVAEDNIVNQKIIVNMLKKFGYLCDIVANGNEVLEALTRNKYDIILMDIQMPEMDGIETTKQIVRKYSSSEIRPSIIAMSAHARNAEASVCTEAGMEGYISKPIDMKELKNTLEFWGYRVKKAHLKI